MGWIQGSRLPGCGGGAGSCFEKVEKMTFGLPPERGSRITSRAAPGIEAYSVVESTVCRSIRTYSLKKREGRM